MQIAIPKGRDVSGSFYKNVVQKKNCKQKWAQKVQIWAQMFKASLA